MRIFGWEAKRSGASLTITGKDGEGDVVKISGVTSIKVQPDGKITARAKKQGVVGLPAQYVDHQLCAEA
jgi:hypothetical protein